MDLDSVRELEEELKKGAEGIRSADYIGESEEYENRLEVLFTVDFEDLDINSIELEGYLLDFTEAYDQIYDVDVHIEVESARFIFLVSEELYSK
jgi:hypothetical protein